MPETGPVRPSRALSLLPRDKLLATRFRSQEMMRVKCAHCGAGNQNASETDTCFQCGNVLGDAPASRFFEALADPGATVDLSKLPADQLPPNIDFQFHVSRG